MRCSPPRLPALLLAALLAASGAAVAGCGLFSTDEAPLPGVYDADEFRVERIGGGVDNVGDAGADLKMTLTDDGRVKGELRLVPTVQISPNGDAGRVPFTGTYTRDGDRVTFAFDAGALSEDYFRTGTPLAEVAWIFYDESDAILGADADAYVIFLERESDVPDEAAKAE